MARVSGPLQLLRMRSTKAKPKPKPARSYERSETGTRSDAAAGDRLSIADCAPGTDVPVAARRGVAVVGIAACVDPDRLGDDSLRPNLICPFCGEKEKMH